MSSVPAGKRNWKCPECGRESLLSIAQLDPIACEECVVKMRGGGTSSRAPTVANSAAGPLGMWAGLPEMTKLGVVAAALLVGALIGYVVGKSSTPGPSTAQHGTSRRSESTSSREPRAIEEPDTDEDTEKTRETPESPGPGYKLVRRRKRADGTYSEDHWVKDPHYDAKKSSNK